MMKMFNNYQKKMKKKNLQIKRWKSTVQKIIKTNKATKKTNKQT